MADEPKSKVFDLGVIDLAPQSTIHNSFDMPFDGYVFKTDASWPAGSNNAIGFKLIAGESILIPANSKDSPYVADDDAAVSFFTIKKLKKGSTVAVEIRNGSTTNRLDLQCRVTVMNFDPRLLGRV